MNTLQTEILDGDEFGISRAIEILRAGDLVAFPTETVFGLGADARNGAAVASIFNAKSRPSFNPLIIHVATLGQARDIAQFNDSADALAAAFWPGPMTLVLPVNPNTGLSSLVTAGLSTIGIRIPSHPAAQRLLQAFDGPVAAPSANPSGKISPTRAQHVIDGLSGRIHAILDGGDCTVGLESTIIGFDPVPTLLRAGGLPNEAVTACLGAPLGTATPSNILTSPGQMASHYAPTARIRLNATNKNHDEVKLGFGPDDQANLNLSPSGDLIEAAANLFSHLHKLDAMKAKTIAVAPIPNSGLGIAINDRLSRAAAPRP